MGEKIEADLSIDKPVVIERKYYLYIPMPVVKNWFRTRGNHAMVRFNTSVTPEMLSRGFTSPSTSSLDQDLVNQFKSMNIKDAILIPFDTSVTERSLKVTVGKAATAANRKLEWAKIDEGYVVRVRLITNNGSNDGQVAQTVAETQETTEAPVEATGRNRR